MAQAAQPSTTRAPWLEALLRPVESADPEADMARLMWRWEEIDREIEATPGEDTDAIGDLCDEQDGVAYAIARLPTVSKDAAAAKATVFAAYFEAAADRPIEGVLLDQVLGWLRGQAAVSGE